MTTKEGFEDLLDGKAEVEHWELSTPDAWDNYVIGSGPVELTYKVWWSLNQAVLIDKIKVIIFNAKEAEEYGIFKDEVPRLFRPAPEPSGFETKLATAIAAYKTANPACKVVDPVSVNSDLKYAICILYVQNVSAQIATEKRFVWQKADGNLDHKEYIGEI